MSIQIGEKIRELRLRDNKTQHEMATVLGITPQAVSRWESGLSYPDVEMFPKIAEYFGVSIDRLYGRDADERELEIERIIKTAHTLRRDNARWNELDALLRDAVRKYPKEYRILLEFCFALHCRSRRTRNDAPEVSLRYALESAEWGEKILAECGDTGLRNEAAHTLKYVYTEHPELGFKIRQLAESMSPIMICRENIFCYVTDKEEALQNAQTFSLECLINMVYFSSWYTGEEYGIVKNTLLDMVKRYIPDGDYVPNWYNKIVLLYVECIGVKLQADDPDAAITLLEELRDLLEAYHTKADGITEYRHTSPSIRALPPYKLHPSKLLCNTLTHLERLVESKENFPKIAERYQTIKNRIEELSSPQP